METAQSYPSFLVEKIKTLLNKIEKVRYLRQQNWAIGIFSGKSPFHLTSINDTQPVLTARDVNDMPATFVADPFIIKHNQRYYMFFEVYNRSSLKGEIAYASSSDGINWKYEKCILKEKYHLSYPYVFKWNQEFYMIPESIFNHSVKLYRATNFPADWVLEKILLKGNYQDSSIFYHDNYWWLFAAESNDCLRLFFSEKLTGPWQKHPTNPLIRGNPHIARPGGRIIAYNNKIIRFAQDTSPFYGKKVYAVEIQELSTNAYSEKSISPEAILQPGEQGWNSAGMHTIDPLQIGENEWLAAVDGWNQMLKIKIPLRKAIISVIYHKLLKKIIKK